MKKYDKFIDFRFSSRLCQQGKAYDMMINGVKWSCTKWNEIGADTLCDKEVCKIIPPISSYRKLAIQALTDVVQKMMTRIHSKTTGWSRRPHYGTAGKDAQIFRWPVSLVISNLSGPLCDALPSRIWHKGVCTYQGRCLTLTAQQNQIRRGPSENGHGTCIQGTDYASCLEVPLKTSRNYTPGTQGPSENVLTRSRFSLLL